MAALYVAAGINHFLNPDMYLKIMPHWLPAHGFLVAFSGVMEIALGLLLLLPRTRPLAAIGIVILLIAVFPANVQMAIQYKQQNHSQLWLALLRLPLQGLLIWWAYPFTKRMKGKGQGSS